MPIFDVSIDLTTANVPTGLVPDVAVERVRKAVEAIPGAGRMSVRWCGAVPPGASVVRVFKAGMCRPLDGSVGDRMAGWITTEVRRALFPRPVLVG